MNIFRETGYPAVMTLSRKIDYATLGMGQASWRACLSLAMLILGVEFWSQTAVPAAEIEKEYELYFSAEFQPQLGVAQAEIQLRQQRRLVRQLKFRAPESRYKALEADGELERSAEGFVWRPPASGGALRYEFIVDQFRESSQGRRYDARMTADWALLRAGDLFPSATVTALKGARARPSLALRGPSGWLFETRYGATSSKLLPFSDPTRLFDRPTGWMMAGDFGIRRQIIAERGVAVVAPKNSKVERMVIIAMLNWNLLELTRVFPDFPERLLIVSAGDPMWRGGLSGPGSLYLHSDRPLISENGTSPLMHELVHVASRFSARRDDDWIVEGLAEYYGIEIMRRSGTMTEPRFRRTIGYLESWAAQRKDPGLRAKKSKGANNAASAVLMYKLDQEIRQLTEGKASLDDAVNELSKNPRKVSFSGLRNAVEGLIGRESEILKTVVL